MNGEKGSHSIDINIPAATTKAKQVKTGKDLGFWDGFGSSCKAWFVSVWAFCKEDSNRVIFSLKVGLAVLLVSLLILFQAPYDVFGANIIWSILTVAIMFEYTVGATFNRGFNRALGSLLAGVLAIIVAQLALSTGHVAEPIIIGASIFLIGAITSMMKQWPTLVPYEYGFRVILFTFCLIIVSGYRMGNPFRTAMDRLYSIAIGGFVAVLVNILVCPMWAGDQLHKELVNSFNVVADSLEECVKKYLEDDGLHNPEFSRTVMDEFPDEPAYRKCRATLNNSAKLDALALSANWEPPHGRFGHFFYPWAQYVKVSAVLRYCAYEVMALHGVLHSEIQSSYGLRKTVQSEIQEVAMQAAELVRSLGKEISTMERSFKTSLLVKVHASTERLQRAMDLHSYIFTSSCEPQDNSSQLLPTLSHASSFTLSDLSGQLPEPASSNGLEKNSNSMVKVQSYHEMMRKQSRRIHSWPPRDVDGFGEGRGLGDEFLPRMRALDSTAALSINTFTSLLIEFVVRTDHLVEEVEELSKMAKFKYEAV